MFNKLTNNKLGIIFGALVVLLLIIWVMDSQKGERTFREELVDIDTASVTEILLYPKSYNYEEVRLFKADDQWHVELNDNLNVSVPDAKITALYNQLLDIKPKRLAARDATKFKDFQVDSSATRIKVIEDGDETLDLIIGRFSYQQQPRSMSTFVRLGNDVDIYEVDGFLEMSFNKDANSFRNGDIISSNFESWKQLSFDYPADSSFNMMKVEGGWIANFANTDSTKTVRFLRQLSNLTHDKYFDDISEEQLSSPVYKLTVETDGGELVEIKGYEQDDRFYLTSSDNKESIFDGSQNKIREKIFIGLNSILP
ncbi:DUF4340 domain-containing protein [Bacteroidota bacterium]